MNQLQVGFAVADITPAASLPMGGYAQRSGVAEGTADPLNCRAAVIDDGQARAAFIALDLVYVSGPWAKPVRVRVSEHLRCEPAHVLLAATHTHSGPAVFRSGLVDADALRDYEQTLAEIVLNTVARAVSTLSSASVCFGEAGVSGVGTNRREEGAATDNRARAIVFRSPDGAALGVMAAYGCHPTVLSAANLLYSRDLFGAAVDVVEERLQAPVVLFNGAAGDVSTRFTRRGQDRGEVIRLGKILGDSIARAAARSVPVSGGPVRARAESFPITLREFPSEEAAQAEVARAAEDVRRLQEADAGTAGKRVAAARLEGAMAQVFLAGRGGAEGFLGYRPTRAVLQFMTIAGCDVVAVPGEMFSLAGAQICTERSRPTLIVGYANDYLGYLVPPEEAARGGYESLISLIDSASVQGLIDRLRSSAGDV